MRSVVKGGEYLDLRGQILEGLTTNTYVETSSFWDYGMETWGTRHSLHIDTNM